jgi:nucleoid-associated protein Lsr2
MAKETIVLLKDDLDGSAAETTIQFAWDGVAYEIDLSKANADALSAVIAPYLAAARRVGGRRLRRAESSPSRESRPAFRGGQDLVAIRAWAAQHGYQVAGRGRISRAVLDAYHNATHPSRASQQVPEQNRERTQQTARRRRPAKKTPAKQAPAKKAASRNSARARQPKKTI